MSNIYVDDDGNIITTTVSNNSDARTMVDIQDAIDITVSEIPELKAVKTILGALLKDTMFEVIYPDGNKAILNYKDALIAISSFGATGVSTITSKAAKALYGKKE